MNSSGHCGNWKDVFKKARQDQINMFKRIEEARTTRKTPGATWTVKKGGMSRSIPLLLRSLLASFV